MVDKLKAYEVDADKKDLSAALKIFKKYNLIDYDPKDNSRMPLLHFILPAVWLESGAV